MAGQWWWWPAPETKPEQMWICAAVTHSHLLCCYTAMSAFVTSMCLLLLVILTCLPPLHQCVYRRYTNMSASVTSMCLLLLRVAILHMYMLLFNDVSANVTFTCLLLLLHVTATVSPMLLLWQHVCCCQINVSMTLTLVCLPVHSAAPTG